jgi:SAM-dependent methyltransferase
MDNSQSSIVNLLPHQDTHGWLLMAAIAHTMDGLPPVLELGCGNGSTAYLHSLLEGSGRKLVSCDNDADWLAQFATALGGEFHEFRHVPDWTRFDPPWDGAWGVCLIDHAPGEQRPLALDAIRNSCQVIVVHDTDGPGYGMEALMNRMQYRFDDRRRRPWTTAVSNTDDLRFLR